MLCAAKLLICSMTNTIPAPGRGADGPVLAAIEYSNSIIASFTASSVFSSALASRLINGLVDITADLFWPNS